MIRLAISVLVGLSFGLVAVSFGPSIGFGAQPFSNAVTSINKNGAPGIPNTWAPARKQALGTAYSEACGDRKKSPIWFTVAEGVLSEVFYPAVDQPQIRDLQFLVTDGVSFFSEQRRDTDSEVAYLNDGLSVGIQGKDKTGRYSFEQEIVTQCNDPVVRIRTRFQMHQTGLKVFVLLNPAIGNTGWNGMGWANKAGLFAGYSDRNSKGSSSPHAGADIRAALLASAPIIESSVGYVGHSDGWQDLKKNYKLTQTWDHAGPGNIALIAELKVPQKGREFVFDLALAFGNSDHKAWKRASQGLQQSFDQVKTDYEKGWQDYLKTLNPGLDSFSQRSAQIIKINEDKNKPGAIVAALNKPGIPYSINASDGNAGGYHLVWPRDLYHSAMGLLSAGDTKTPVDTLKFLFETQYSDGSWSQNYWLDGSSYWKSIQMDEIAFPILLAYHLQKKNIYTLTAKDLDHVRKAAEFILNKGPSTQQDRWEEIGGYVPSSLAATILGLLKAGELTGEQKFTQKAHEWNRRIEEWTVVKNGPIGTNYYLRASPSGFPNSSEWIQIANGGSHYLASEILDGGFLELVRLGLRKTSAAIMKSTMALYEDPKHGIADQGIIFRTLFDFALGRPNYGRSQKVFGKAMAYRRYNYDGYGAGNRGGFWPILSGERGHFALAEGDFTRAENQLALLKAAANDAGLLPEQTVHAPTKGQKAIVGKGVPQPLAWSHAEQLLLQRSVIDKRIFDQP